MKKILLIMLMFPLLSANLAFAQNAIGDPNPPRAIGDPGPDPKSTQSTTKLQNPIKVDSIQDVIYLAVDIAIYIGVCFAILAIIFVGFKFVMAQGNETKLAEAKTWFFYIIIGLAILISSKVIVEIIRNTLVDAGVVKKEALWP